MKNCQCACVVCWLWKRRFVARCWFWCRNDSLTLLCWSWAEYRMKFVATNYYLCIVTCRMIIQARQVIYRYFCFFEMNPWQSLICMIEFKDFLRVIHCFSLSVLILFDTIYSARLLSFRLWMCIVSLFKTEFTMLLVSLITMEIVIMGDPFWIEDLK